RAAEVVEEFVHELDRVFFARKKFLLYVFQRFFHAKFFHISAFESAAADVSLHATTLAAETHRPARVDGHVPPFASDALYTGEGFSIMHDTAAAARAHDHAKDQLVSPARSKQRLGHRKTIRVVLDFNFPRKNLFQIRFHVLAVHASRVGIA